MIWAGGDDPKDKNDPAPRRLAAPGIAGIDKGTRAVIASARNDAMALCKGSV